MSPKPSLLSGNTPQSTLSNTLLTVVEKLGKSLLDFIFPLVCPGCNKRGAWICEECLLQFRPVEYYTCAVCGKRAIKGATHRLCQDGYSLDRLMSIYQYQGPVRRAVHWLKYRDVTGLKDILVRLMWEEIGSLGLEFGGQAIVAPVPLHWQRGFKRGYNQAELLAKPLAENLGLAYQENLLRRVRDTKSQIKLKRKERLENVAAAFEIPSDSLRHVKNRDVLLVDDVCTTGATLNSCAATLKQAGARYVWGLTLARD